ncbi:MAG TPA: acyl-CoA thioesterase [Cytophagaceae bacterium]|nr:acyl-CoA thioesterase [Cytophagaceae bacterium]
MTNKKTELDKSNYKPVSYSQTTITELMIPSYANFGGKIHGGILLSLMDKVAYACAAKHSGDYCVTVSVDTVDFLHPVEVGDLVSLLASVNHVGKTSLVVGIKVLAENVTKGNVRHTNTSFFTMVCMGTDNKPKEIPGLVLENREDVRRYLEAIKRKELKNNYKKELNNQKTRITIDKELYKLENERCIIKNL